MFRLMLALSLVFSVNTKAQTLDDFEKENAEKMKAFEQNGDDAMKAFEQQNADKMKKFEENSKKKMDDFQKMTEDKMNAFLGQISKEITDINERNEADTAKFQQQNQAATQVQDSAGNKSVATAKKCVEIKNFTKDMLNPMLETDQNGNKFLQNSVTKKGTNYSAAQMAASHECTWGLIAPHVKSFADQQAGRSYTIFMSYKLGRIIPGAIPEYKQDKSGNVIITASCKVLLKDLTAPNNVLAKVCYTN